MSAPTEHEQSSAEAAIDGDRPGVLTRRHVLGAAGAVGAAGVLAACGGGTTPNEAISAAQSAASQAASAAQSAASAVASAASEAAGSIAAAADIPVEGGKVFEQAKVVVTQPATGEFKAFTAVCTHQGCLVNSVEANVISCPCHGSQFSAEDGSVIKGPATQPLAPAAINVKGGDISLG